VRSCSRIGAALADPEITPEKNRKSQQATPQPKQPAIPVNLILDNSSRSFALSRFARNSPEHFLKE
jgi:hypothetical protein